MEKQLITITGPSGVGKTTVVQLLYTIAPNRFIELVSTTTRKPRDGEEEGVAYHFVGCKEFQARSEQQKFLEEVEYNGTRYGVEFSEIEKAHSTGLTPLIVVEPGGARQILERYQGGLIQIYLDAPELNRRLWMWARGDVPLKAEERIILDRIAITRGSFAWHAVIENNSTLPSLLHKVLKAIE